MTHFDTVRDTYHSDNNGKVGVGGSQYNCVVVYNLYIAAVRAAELLASESVTEILNENTASVQADVNYLNKLGLTNVGTRLPAANQSSNGPH